MYRDTTNVEPEMYDYTSNNWSHWNSNEKLKEKFGSCTWSAHTPLCDVPLQQIGLLHTPSSLQFALGLFSPVPVCKSLLLPVCL